MKHTEAAFKQLTTSESLESMSTLKDTAPRNPMGQQMNQQGARNGPQNELTGITYQTIGSGLNSVRKPVFSKDNVYALDSFVNQRQNSSVLSQNPYGNIGHFTASKLDLKSSRYQTSYGNKESFGRYRSQLSKQEANSFKIQEMIEQPKITLKTLYSS